MIPKRAIVSVYDKKNLDKLCMEMKKHKVEIYATGGTGEYLRKHGIDFKSSDEYTGFTELLGGRVKTLNTKLHAAILGDIDELKDLGIKPIDMVVCNFYPVDFGIEGMDIGGPAITRAAAKNWKRVIVVSSPEQYDDVIEKFNTGFDEEFRKKLAIEAIRRTAYYDAMLVDKNESFPHLLTLPFIKKMDLRYGENPHQRGAFYVKEGVKEACISNAQQLHGKMLSYNNILDSNHAIECVKEFDEPSAVIIKHATPSGIASADTIEKAWRDAYETDIYSPFGGVVAFNREITGELAEELSRIFLEVVIAPSFDDEALKILKNKKNLRLLKVKDLDVSERVKSIEVRSVEGGLLLQEKDVKKINPSEWKVVTEKKPNEKDIKSMVFAIKSVRHIKSNAVVFVKGTKTVAIGGGQTARVDAVWIAVHKGKDRIKGSIMASDAFFPFRDAIDLAAEAGVYAVVQPGGSIRDKEVIEAANEHGIIMVFTGQRSFLH